MNSQSIKLELIKLLLETDEPSLLEKVRKILTPAADKGSKNIVGYEPNGDPITQEYLARHMKKSIEQVEKGEVMSHEDLVKESENW